MRLNRDAYSKLIEQDIAWLEQQQPSPERNHAIAVLKRSVSVAYPPVLTTDESLATKQVLVVRKDLNMRKGKAVAQGAHGAMAWMSESYRQGIPFIDLTLEQRSWLGGLFTKICTSVDSERELIETYEKADSAGLTVSLITDAGLTEFAGTPTRTCIAIGPHESQRFVGITDALKLF